MKKIYHQKDDGFYWLAKQITSVIQHNSKEYGLEQKEEVEKLMVMEELFRKEILKYGQSRSIYELFILKIVASNKNILSARPYFRERAATFSKEITPAIKEGNVDALQQFKINFLMISFIMKSWKGQPPARVQELFVRIEGHRKRLIENNLPLAINQAKLFFRKTPTDHLDLMDMIGLCASGLASGIDKWTGKYSTVFRSVCIGRMKGNLIDEYNETLMHFYPNDKRILYKANAIRYRQKITDMDKLSEAVRNAFIEDEKEGKKAMPVNVTTAELRLLMNASSMISADSKSTNEDGKISGPYAKAYDLDYDIERSYIESDSLTKTWKAAKNLSVVQRKILRLKGMLT